MQAFSRVLQTPGTQCCGVLLMRGLNRHHLHEIPRHVPGLPVVICFSMGPSMMMGKLLLPMARYTGGCLTDGTTLRGQPRGQAGKASRFAIWTDAQLSSCTQAFQSNGQALSHRQGGGLALQVLQEGLLQLHQLPPHLQPVYRLRPPLALRLHICYQVSQATCTMSAATPQAIGQVLISDVP